jgi:hypothetical protein
MRSISALIQGGTSTSMSKISERIRVICREA